MSPSLHEPAPLCTCAVILDPLGRVVELDREAARACGLSEPLPEQDCNEWLLQTFPDWEGALPGDWAAVAWPLYLPVVSGPEELPVVFCIHGLPCEGRMFLQFSARLALEEVTAGAALEKLCQRPHEVGQLLGRLRRAENRLASTLSLLPGVVFSQRADLSFDFLSDGIRSIFNLDPQQLLRRSAAFVQMIHAPDRLFVLQQLEAGTTQRKAFSLNYRIEHPTDGHLLHVLDVRSPLFSPSGLFLGYEGVWLDVTRQAVAENRLTSASWKDTLATVTSGLVHDFSNVMTGIYSLSELYCGSLAPEHPMFEGVQQIKKSAQQAQKLVRRIIDLNREHAGTRNYHNLETLLKDQIELIASLLPKHTEIVCNLQGREFPVYVDDVGFRQVLLNLACNARDAVEGVARGRIEITTLHVALGEQPFRGTALAGWTAEREGVLVCFADNGCGIPPELHEKIFDLHFTTKEVHKGSGLGLYNARLFVRNHQGLVGVRSAPGSGTAFLLYLPLADFTETRPEAEGDPLAPGQGNERRPVVAVYGAGDPEGFDLVEMMRSMEWEVVAFGTGPKLMKYLREGDLLPDTVVFMHLGQDPEVDRLLHQVRTYYPRVRRVVFHNGEIPDALAAKWEGQADLMLDGGANSLDLLRRIAQDES